MLFTIKFQARLPDPSDRSTPANESFFWKPAFPDLDEEPTAYLHPALRRRKHVSIRIESMPMLKQGSEHTFANLIDPPTDHSDLSRCLASLPSYPWLSRSCLSPSSTSLWVCHCHLIVPANTTPEQNYNHLFTPLHNPLPTLNPISNNTSTLHTHPKPNRTTCLPPTAPPRPMASTPPTSPPATRPT